MLRFTGPTYAIARPPSTPHTTPPCTSTLTMEKRHEQCRPKGRCCLCGLDVVGYGSVHTVNPPPTANIENDDKDDRDNPSDDPSETPQPPVPLEWRAQC
jgi:hypothetical protein